MTETQKSLFYSFFADAIIYQGIFDYRKARNKIRIHPRSTSASETYKECEEFFRSDWFKILVAVCSGEMPECLSERDKL